MGEKLLLKDQLVNKKSVTYVSRIIKEVYSDFDNVNFEKEVFEKFKELELKERIYWTREKLEEYLPNEYSKTLKILLDSVKGEKIEEFIICAYTSYVSVNGCEDKYLEESLSALGELTEHFSSEFDIRDFINKYPKRTFEEFKKWSKSKNEHKRRLASEGLRPKLPWAKKINFDYKKGAEILDSLYYDNVRYVTRSVANHMNDISKIEPEFAIKKLAKWKKEGKQEEKEMSYIIRHALRTLIKKGNSQALELLGYNSNVDFEITNLQIKNNKIKVGEAIEFEFKLEANNNCNAVIDYKVTYANPNGRISEKVFKLKNTEFKKDKIVEFSKKHYFRKMTTKKLHPGKHKLEIQANGKLIGKAEFYLEV